MIWGGRRWHAAWFVAWAGMERGAGGRTLAHGGVAGEGTAGAGRWTVCDIGHYSMQLQAIW